MWKSLTGDLALVSAASTATIVAFGVVRRQEHGRYRWAWTLVALAMGGSLIAEVLWGYHGLVNGDELPFPSAADAFYLGAYPLLLVASLLLVRRSSGTRWRPLQLDWLLFTLAAIGLFFDVVVVPELAEIEGSLVVALVVVYPLADILLIVGLGALLFSQQGEALEGSIVVLAASFAVCILADLAWISLMLHDRYVSGSFVDSFWALSYILTGFAALLSARELDARRQPAQPAKERKRLAQVRFALVHGLLPGAAAAIGLGLAHAQAGQPLTPLAIGLGSGLLATVMLRQFVALRDNVRLTRSMAVLAEDLEQRVNERTRDLLALNKMARALSRCRESEHVLEVSLRHSLGLLRAEAAVIVLYSGNEQRIGAHCGPSALVSCLAQAGLNQEKTGSGQLCLPTGYLPLPAPDGHEQHLAGLVGIQALRLPLLAHGITVGSLLVAVKAPLPGTVLDMLSEALAAQIGIALENARQFEQLRDLASRDSLTGLYNHRALQEELERSCGEAERKGEQFTVIMMDIDGFKLFNDTYGHPCGDDILCQVADVLRHTLRSTDLIVRNGGDEFVAVLPATGAEKALALCERVRSAVAKAAFSGPKGRVPLSLSLGLACYPVHGTDPAELIAHADIRLYEAKHRGGNTIAVLSDASNEESPPVSDRFSVFDGLVTAVDHKDRYTRHHSEDVTTWALRLAQHLQLSNDEREALRIAGMLHDVGKIGVPDRILRKPGPLTREEHETVRQHVVLGELILSQLPHAAHIVEIVASHHERWDGAGYPRGLAGQQIPYLGRLLAVCDAWSAMTTDRPYRTALSQEEAQDELERAKGSQFDANLVDAFVTLLTVSEPGVINAEAVDGANREGNRVLSCT